MLIVGLLIKSVIKLEIVRTHGDLGFGLEIFEFFMAAIIYNWNFTDYSIFIAYNSRFLVQAFIKTHVYRLFNDLLLI